MSAHNEESVIKECIRSVRDFADEVIIVDSGSTDRTVQVAEAMGAKVVRAKNQLMLNENKNLAIEAARGDWILLLDPDEVVTAELAEALISTASSLGAVSAYWILRRDRELGRWIKRLSPQLRFFRGGCASFPCKDIHESVKVEGSIGAVQDAKALLLHFPKQSLFEYVHKRNLYSEHRAIAMDREGVKFSLIRMVLRPPRAFIKSYVFRGCWRDGIAGFVISVMASMGTFLQDAKLWQMQKGASFEHDKSRTE